MKTVLAGLGIVLGVFLTGSTVQDNMPLPEVNEVSLPIVEVNQARLEKEHTRNLAVVNADSAAEERAYLSQVVYETQLASNRLDIETAITETLDHVGSTWYVLGGSTPRGWDCSGLTLWFYDKLAIELPHSASAQAELGWKVDEPQVGDLILIGQHEDFIHHSAIYIGDGKLVHSGWTEGRKTEVLNLTDPVLEQYHVEFRRFLDID